MNPVTGDGTGGPLGFPEAQVQMAGAVRRKEDSGWPCDTNDRLDAQPTAEIRGQQTL